MTKMLLPVMVLALTIISCNKEEKLSSEFEGNNKNLTFWTAICCDLEGGGTGTECTNGRRDMCHDAYECSTDDDPTVHAAMQNMWLEHYTQEEIDDMINNETPIENGDVLNWLNENTNIPLK